MAFTFHFSVTFDWNGTKKPNLKHFVLCNDKIVSGKSLTDWSTPENPIEQLPHIGNQYNKEIISDTEHHKFEIDIDESIENEYTLIIEHSNAEYPDDYINGDFGVNIKYLDICGVDLCDLIHRRGHIYLDCTGNSYYILNNINDIYDKFIVEDYRLLHFRHNLIRGNKARVYNNITDKFNRYAGYFVTKTGYICKGKNLYYNCTKDIYFIADNAGNKNLYVDGDKLFHHVPNDATISLNGRWELKFKTPFYAWVTDNIFGNDFA